MMVTFVINAYMIILGCIVGSFLNVCIFRIPNHENVSTTRSHCQHCGNVLQWYELVPVLSYIFLRGRCKNCHTKISIQYPIIELLNGILYCMIVMKMGMNVRAFLTCALTSCLIVISVIDWRTYEIPVGLNVFIGIVGIINLIFDYQNWIMYLIGAVCVSGFLLVIYLVTKGRGIGGGDIKLMAAAGFFLGWQQIILSFILGCVLASVIHLLRMKITKDNNVLAFGPYLSVGIFISAMFGKEIIQAYLNMI